MPSFFACAPNGEYEKVDSGERLPIANTDPAWIWLPVKKPTMGAVRYPLAVKAQLKVFRGDRIQCRTWGTFWRTDGSRPNLPHAYTKGTFEVGKTRNELETTMGGADAYVAYDVSVSMVEVP